MRQRSHQSKEGHRRQKNSPSLERAPFGCGSSVRVSFQRRRSRDDRRGTSQIDSALIQVGQASCEVTGVLLPVVSGPGQVDLSSRAPNQELRVPGC